MCSDLRAGGRILLTIVESMLMLTQLENGKYDSRRERRRERFHAASFDGYVPQPFTHDRRYVHLIQILE